MVLLAVMAPEGLGALTMLALLWVGTGLVGQEVLVHRAEMVVAGVAAVLAEVVIRQ
jgi:hypothetical protein